LYSQKVDVSSCNQKIYQKVDVSSCNQKIYQKVDLFSCNQKIFQKITTKIEIVRAYPNYMGLGTTVAYSLVWFQ